ncbi:MAG: dihydroorotase [Bacteroidales bacterium]|nr:dihydroorotase [Bacteroidales bacterium]
MKTLITNATIINEGKTFEGSVLINGCFIEAVYPKDADLPTENIEKIDIEGRWLMPGIIDDQVHFREPGLTHKGNIASESRAAVAGGVTSFMDMPNVNPQTTTQEELKKKFEIGAKDSVANYSFYFGATNDNIDELLKTDPKTTCGIKVFMGSSTGNMLVNNPEVLEAIFSKAPMLVATHCEDEATINANSEYYRNKYGEEVPIKLHPKIRSEEACYLSSSYAVNLAKKYGTRLHVLHLSTAKELSLFEDLPIGQKKITAEVCVHHLWFSEEDYETKGTLIKWNPAVKRIEDRDALLEAVSTNKIAVIATDHAPHTITEKSNTYFKAPSGGPMVQHSLITMLELAKDGKITKEKVVEKMCHAPADLFQIEKRGYIREGYYADLVVINPKAKWTISKENILYHCGWSPLEGQIFSHQVIATYVNGNLVFDNGKINEQFRGQALKFNR